MKDMALRAWSCRGVYLADVHSVYIAGSREKDSAGVSQDRRKVAHVQSWPPIKTKAEREVPSRAVLTFCQRLKYFHKITFKKKLHVCMWVGVYKCPQRPEASDPHKLKLKEVLSFLA